jgi:mono/diheme cytochrome c family protein
MLAHIRISRLALGLALSLTIGTPLFAQTAGDSLPAGVTEAMVARGKAVFTGPGVCFACHGMDGAGTAGPSLADSVWIHNRGEYEKIVLLIRNGVDEKTSKSGLVMPPRGGSAINDDDLRAVAAYVWTLSRRPEP